MVKLELDLGHSRNDIYFREYKTKKEAMECLSSYNSFVREFNEELEGGFSLSDASVRILSEKGRCIKKFDNLKFLERRRYPDN